MKDTYQEQSPESQEQTKKLENPGKWQFNLWNPVITLVPFHDKNGENYR